MTPHPLDPLTFQEIQAAADLARKDEKFQKYRDFKFISITLIEPAKEDVFCYDSNACERKSIDRKANAILAVNDDTSLWECDVNLTTSTVDQWKQVKSGQPPVNSEEFAQIEKAVKMSPMVLAALKKRGISNTDNLIVDPWPCGRYNFGYEAEGQRRRVMSLLFQKTGDDSFFYAHPIDGVVPIVDLHLMEVVYVDDSSNDRRDEPLPIPAAKSFFYHEKPDNLKPISITQPDGPSFEVQGNEVKWAGWSLRVGFTDREGLVLHCLTYEGRSVLYRAALSEMFVPYGDPAPGQFRKNAFDMGEYGAGKGANSLRNGCDCFGKIHYFDGVIADGLGNAVRIPNAICLHEEDAGRSRKLVLSFISSFANYDYAFYWYLFLDGTIKSEVKLTGVVSVGAFRDNFHPKYGTILGPNLYAPIHQHFFCFRLDFAVDGVNNSALRIDTEAESVGSHNSFKTAFFAKSTLLKSTVDAQGVVDSRKNPNKTNKDGQPAGYRLVPGRNAFPYARNDSIVMKRGGFVKNHFWVTPYNPDQLFAGGKFIMQNDDGNNLERWAGTGASIENRDIVAWYTVGAVHVVRPEDFPIMPCTSVGFEILPDGFFTQNPIITDHTTN